MANGASDETDGVNAVVFAMDDLREILEEAYRLDDEARRNFEQWEAKMHSRLEKRSGDFGLIYQTHEPTEKQQRSPTMDAEQQRRWDEWCDARIDKMFEESFVPAIAEFASLYVSKRLNAEIAKLYGEIADLKVLVATLTTEAKSLRDAGNVVSIGKSNAA